MMDCIDELIGQTLSKIIKKDDRLVFITTTGKRYIMYHDQDCCEDVYIEDIVGDLDDLIGSPIITAREDFNVPSEPMRDGEESWTWTFYNLATIKGSVTIRWYGSSNGYYSESANVRYISRMPKWMRMLYIHGVKQKLSDIKVAIFDDIEKCFIEVADNYSSTELYDKKSVQELIDYLHDNDAFLV